MKLTLYFLMFTWTFLIEIFCFHLLKTSQCPPVLYVFGYSENNELCCFLDLAWYSFEGEWAFTYEWKVLLLSLSITFLALTPESILIPIALVALAVAAYSDWKTYYASELCILTIMSIGVACGLKNGHIIISLIAAILICIYEAVFHDSAFFGGADTFILLGLLAYFGFCTWVICLLIASLVALIIKAVLWISKKQGTEDHNISFLPSIMLGAILAKIIDIRWAHLYTLSWNDFVVLLKLLKK